MNNVLLIKSSILGENSVSSKYAEKLIEQLPDVSLKIRDVAENPVGILDSKDLMERSQKKGLKYDEHISLINEVKEHNVLVLAVPMYNFSIPLQLHAYFDALTIGGESFHYEKDGTHVGHLKNKRAYVVLSRGGIYKENGLTFQEEYIKAFLNFLGITDIEYIFIEGCSMGKTEDELNQQFQEQLNKLNR